MQLIDHYQAIADTSSQMLAAAKESAWDELRALETRVALQISTLKAKAEASMLPPEQDHERMRLLKQMLANDAQIRDIMNPWVKDFAFFLSPAATHGRSSSFGQSGGGDMVPSHSQPYNARRLGPSSGPPA